MTFGSFFSAGAEGDPASGAEFGSCSLMLETPPVCRGNDAKRPPIRPQVTVCVKEGAAGRISSDISLSRRGPASENTTVVVQCPTCQSKFRIADDKVTDRGVRVRCTSCKNVFQVRKPGAAASAEPAPAPGSTIDLSSLDAAQVGSGQSRPAAASRPLPASGPSAASRPPGVAARSGNGAARRLDADDLFGMAELTGDAPLGDLAPPKVSPPSPPP